MKRIILLVCMACSLSLSYADIRDQISTNKNTEIEVSQSKGFDIITIPGQSVTDESRKTTIACKNIHLFNPFKSKY